MQFWDGRFIVSNKAVLWFGFNKLIFYKNTNEILMKEFTLAIDYVGCIILKWRIVILCKEVYACDEINVLVV